MSVIQEILDERSKIDPDEVGPLIHAAVSYAEFAGMGEAMRWGWLRHHIVPRLWPWAPLLWAPSTKRKDMLKATALLVAAIERSDEITEQGKIT